MATEIFNCCPSLLQMDSVAVDCEHPQLYSRSTTQVVLYTSIATVARRLMGRGFCLSRKPLS